MGWNTLPITHNGVDSKDPNHRIRRYSVTSRTAVCGVYEQPILNNSTYVHYAACGDSCSLRHVCVPYKQNNTNSV